MSSQPKQPDTSNAVNRPYGPSGSAESARKRTITQWRDGAVKSADDHVAIEEPLEIRIGDEPLAVTMRTPGHDRDLAAGFCLTEGVIEHGDELEQVERCSESKTNNVIVVTLTDEALARRQTQIACAKRELYLSSSCGLCGKQSLDRIEQKVSPVPNTLRIQSKLLMMLPDRMREAQPTFEQTGGLHAAAMFDVQGKLLLLREDVGRHNAVDKVIGASLLLGELPLHGKVLLVSGRTSFEIMQKAAMAGVEVVAAISAPSSLAIDFAVRLNMTLAGFIRPGKMNVYHDVGRLVD